MTAEPKTERALDMLQMAMRAEVDRIPCDGHWWVHRDADGRRSVVWDAAPHMVWSAGDEEWCVAERERLNEDPRAATLLAALRGFVTLTSARGNAIDAARLAEMLAYVRTEPLQLGIANANADADKAYCLWQANNGKLVKALDAIGVAVEARRQAEATRDAAQAVATRAEERARAERERAERAEAERDEWRACAEEGARLIGAQHINSAMAWAAATLYSAAAQAIYVPDPSAGTGDHEREPGRNDACG